MSQRCTKWRHFSPNSHVWTLESAKNFSLAGNPTSIIEFDNFLACVSILCDHFTFSRLGQRSENRSLTYSSSSANCWRLGVGEMWTKVQSFRSLVEKKRKKI